MIILLLCFIFSCQAMDTQDIEMGTLKKSSSELVLSRHVDLNLHVHADIKHEELGEVIKHFLPGANGNVQKNVTPYLHTLIRQHSQTAQDRQSLPPDEIRKLIAASIDQALGQKDQELEEGNLRMAKLKRNQKIIIVTITACTTIITAILTAIVTLVPSQTACYFQKD